MVKVINEKLFRKMVKAADIVLKQNIDYINALNVFPVPDGDTGSNTSATVASGDKYVKANHSDSVGDLFQSFAKGLLMGARGNSGVITSQIFRGFAQSVKNNKNLSPKDIELALINASISAYHGVMTPTEGTILTVIREIAQASINSSKKHDDLAKMFDNLYTAAHHALLQTPNLLPVLKKVGVVDSGGQGLVLIFKAWDAVIDGKSIQKATQVSIKNIDAIINRKHKSAQSKLNPADIKYGYCTQMTLRFGRGKECNRKFNYQSFYNYLAQLGNSLLVANDNNVVKVHVHTEHPGKVLAFGQHYGDLTKVKVDNMRKQQEDIINRDKHNKTKKAQSKKSIFTPKQFHQMKTAVVSVSVGDGLYKLFRSVGVLKQVHGGQTMNPSTQAILNVIKACHKQSVIVLPNNGNVYLASKVAAKQTKQNVKVLPNHSVQSGLSVMIDYQPNASIQDNFDIMKSDLADVKAGEITYASRNQDVNGLNVKKNDCIAIYNKKVIACNNHSSVVNTTYQAVKKMFGGLDEVVTLYVGQNVDKSVIDKISKRIKTISDDVEVEIHHGGQPIYPILIEIE